MHNGNVCHMPFPSIGGVPVSDTFIIIGRTNSGKSVTFRNIYWFIAKSRPIVVMDYTGRDHYWSALPGDGENIAPGTSASKVKGEYIYFPEAGARKKSSWEDQVRPNITKYNHEQLTRLGFSDSGARYIKNILSRYGPFKNMETLFHFIEQFPINDYEWKKIDNGDVHLKHKHPKMYEQYDAINFQTKGSIIKVLYGLMEMRLFRTDSDQEPDYKEMFTDGKNIFFSYNNLMLARAEIDWYFSQLERWRDEKPKGNRPYVFVEEAHKIFSGTIAEFIATCRKLSVGVALCMPIVPDDVPEDVLGDIKGWIVGKLKGKAYLKVAGIINDDRTTIIPRLRSNMFTGEREMLYYNGHWDQLYAPIMMFKCPQQIHTEV